MEFLASFGGAFSGVWFALFVLLFIVSGIFSAETDSFFAGSLTFIIGLSSLDLFFNFPVWETVVSNPLSILLFLGLYVVAGSVYAGFWRWTRFIKEHSDVINDGFVRWSKSENKQRTSENFELYLESSSYHFSASNHKQKFATWIMLWPFGLLWDLAHRPARWLFNTLYFNLGTIFDKIGKRTARNLQGKFK